MEKCNPEVCDLRFDSIEQRLDKMEEREEKKSEEITVIKEAIVEIKTTNQQMAKVLEKLESKIDSSAPTKESFWNTKFAEKLGFYIMAVIIVAILALAGSQIFDNIDALSKIIK